MSKRSIYTCDGCGTEKPGREIESLGIENVPSAWLTLRTEDYNPADLRAASWHYCSDCAKRVVAMLRGRLLPAAAT